jgi:hypothetical protein
MTDLSSSDPDPLAEWLTVSCSPDDNVAALRQTVLQGTTRVLRRRRWARRAAVVAGLAACYAAGMASMYWLTPLTPPQVVIVEKIPETTPAPPPPTLQVPRETESSAVALEWEAVESPDKRVECYRRAGDQYLAESNDTESALRCYRQMLNAASNDDLAISPDDNSLLMALKSARLKEKRNAKPN